MQSESTQSGRSLFFAVTFIVALVATFLLGLLASSITMRKAEARRAYVGPAGVDQFEPRSELWGKNYPREYESYLSSRDTTFRSKYNGSAVIDMLEVNPRLVVIWAGYGFAKAYNQSRGHYYALEDVRKTPRTGGPTGPDEGPMPSTCWTCKSPDVPRVMNRDGVAQFYKGKWARLGPEIANTIGCADCHSAEDMGLQISRPALVEAYQRMGKDITEATHQEMRSLVCAQCHVEYYFQARPDTSKYLTFPWDNGMSVEEMEQYYDELDFSDWTHALSRAPMLKAQHPGYEVFLTGVHAQRGLACADCHMPYMTEGGQKFTNHRIVSPLANVANTCQVCHREETEQLVKDVHERQDRIIGNRDKLEELLVRAHVEAKLAWDKGATDQQMRDILMDIRHAQWRWDYAAASHGGSFHSPVEIGRIVGTGIEIAQEARIKLARLLSDLGHNHPVPYPDISTKAKAQAYIGLPMDRLRSEKKSFLENLLPQWLRAAKDREAKQLR
jgi:nitrite reductase (cytochrome c-552)